MTISKTLAAGLLLLSPTLYAGNTIEIDVRQLLPGEVATLRVGGDKFYVIRRTPAERERLSNASATPGDRVPLRNGYRSIRPELFIVYASCPGSKEESTYAQGEGFFCPGGAAYDLAGRSRTGESLSIPEYRYKGEFTIVIRSLGRVRDT